MLMSNTFNWMLFWYVVIENCCFVCSHGDAGKCVEHLFWWWTDEWWRRDLWWWDIFTRFFHSVLYIACWRWMMKCISSPAWNMIMISRQRGPFLWRQVHPGFMTHSSFSIFPVKYHSCDTVLVIALKFHLSTWLCFAAYVTTVPVLGRLV